MLIVKKNPQISQITQIFREERGAYFLYTVL